MKIGSTEQDQRELEEADVRMAAAAERRRAEKERRELEEAEARMTTALRKAKKARKEQIKKEISEQYISPRNTGRIEWAPKHSLGRERWEGTMSGKKVFKIESGIYKYSLKILSEELILGHKDSKPKLMAEMSFEKAAKKAENIIENYLKLLKKKKKDEVSQNNSTGG